MASETKEFKWIGKRTIRPDGIGKVTGRDKFGADFSLPGMIVGKVVRKTSSKVCCTSQRNSTGSSLMVVDT